VLDVLEPARQQVVKKSNKESATPVKTPIEELKADELKAEELKADELQHASVLLDDTVNWCVTDPEGVYIDCTFGRGGHSQLILQNLGPKGRLVVFDKDPAAIAVAEAINDPRLTVIHDSFARLGHHIEELLLAGQVTGILMDLGVSSPQLDDAERGFSFMRSGPLDMRMNSSAGETAAQWLANVDEKTLAHVIYRYGEEKMSRRIARKICETRVEKPLTTTGELAALIETVVPRRHGKGSKHPATRTFQAIRIFLNQELEDLELGLVQAVKVLQHQGRLVVLSFHSLEDRIVKRFMQSQAMAHDQLPAKLPVRADTLKPEFKLLVKGVKPKDQEVEHNARARSAVLRVGERLKP